MKAMLLVNRVWDLVTGTRVRPNPTPEEVIVFGQAHANQAEIIGEYVMLYVPRMPNLSFN